MNRRFLFISGKAPSSNFFAFILCAAFFLSGCVLAVFSAGYVSDAEILSDYMSLYLQMIEDGGAVDLSFLSVFFNTAKYHIAAVFLGFSVIGFLCIPILSAVRGFFFTFSIAVIIRLYGGDGILLALCLFGINALVALPCYFILAARSFCASKSLFGMAAYPGQKSYAAPYRDGYFMCCLICLGLLLLAAVVDTYLVTFLVRLVARGMV